MTSQYFFTYDVIIRFRLLEEQESSMNSIRVQLAKKQRMVEGLEKVSSVMTSL